MSHWDTLWMINQRDQITHVNEGYKQFARDNGAEHLAEGSCGRSLWDFVTGPDLTQIYVSLIRRLRGGLGPFEMSFRCDSPDCRRKLRMRVEGVGLSRGIMFRSRLIEAQPREPIALLDPSANRAANAKPIPFCSWTNRLWTPRGWLEVEEAVEELQLFQRDTQPPLAYTISDEALGQLMRQIETLGSAGAE
ncbi:MAG: hypothetical protein ACLFUJ_02155 [Phycisphaerae bacterium]